jgi:peptidoglycan/LPS O-acetylase OafA/YrhL
MRNPFSNEKAPSEVRGKSISYRPELDGIRGISILIIVFHHMDYLGIKHFGGRGFLGVDIFFVLSGFLITQILLTYKAKGIKLRTFYKRRVARLYPILLLSVVGISFYFRNDFNFFDRWPAIASVLYIKNFFHWGGVFGPMWSLAAEEQFYLIFPVVLLLGLKFFKKNKLTVLLIIWLAVIWTFAYKSAAPDYNFNQDGIFNLVVFRPSIILVGSLIAMHKDYLEELVARLWFIAFSIFALGVYVTIVTQYPPLAGLSTGLLILLLSEPARQRTFFARRLRGVLAFKPLAWIGLLSYSIYIWHLPMIYITSEHFMIHSLSPVWLFLVKLLAVSMVSFYLFERPVLRLAMKTTKNT